MTVIDTTEPGSAAGTAADAEETGYAELAARFAPVFARIAEGALGRDLARELPFEAVRWLNEERFGALRVPVSHGGFGASLETLVRLLVDLAAADPNVAHLYRSHIGFVEALRWESAQVQERWYGRAAAGETVGNASTEKGGNALGSVATRLVLDDDGYRLDGEKFYSTGTIFAEWTMVTAGLDSGEDRHFAIVRTGQPGVEILDDWDGFGQKLTGTGTTRFHGARVEAGDVFPRRLEATHQSAVFQLVLLSVLAGIARASRDEAASIVRSRTRTFNTGSGALFREDPLILQIVGKIGAKAFAAEAAVVAAAREIDAALQERDFVRANVAVDNAQVVVPELALAAAQQLFEATGASSVSTAKGLDRHWRNAQTVATHNPAAFKARQLGDHLVNGVAPVGLNAIGEARRTD
ncbi:acyl-CoA dehydrogenase family protein [Arthrobacter ginkgonis]|uniref:Acyl-CoA dehydrogenase family protein n=1 Tax=Arthrobacter ginkgonis TaxID=1630594 RepID=A0ABP7BU67_9MICC